MAKSFDEQVKRTTTKRTQARAAHRTQELLAELVLGEIRQLAGKSQQEVAKALGIKQPTLSKLENQSNMRISTLRNYVESLGGELEFRVKLPKRVVKIDLFRASGSRPGLSPLRRRKPQTL